MSTAHLWLRLPLLPLLVAQGLRVRNRALILPEAPGPRQGTLGQGAPLRLLILGDSAAAGVGAPDQSEALSGHLARALAPHVSLTWQLEARTGATSAQTLRHLEKLDGPFDAALISLGVNDVTHAVPLSRWLATHRQIHTALRAKGVRHILMTPVPPIHLFPALPQPLRWILGQEAKRFNAALPALLAESQGAELLAFDLPMDPALMAADGFHPAPPLYKLWAEAAAQRLLNTFQARPTS